MRSQWDRELENDYSWNAESQTSWVFEGLEGFQLEKEKMALNCFLNDVSSVTVLTYGIRGM